MYSIKKAQKSDQDAIYQLVKTVLSDYGIKTNPEVTDKDLSDLDDYYFHNRGWFALVEYDRQLIGSFGIFRINDRICELRKMYLLSDFQGLGIGKQMMNEAEKIAIELGYKEMILESNRALTKARKLYEKYGFKEYRPDHLSDRCDFAMRKIL